MMDWEEHMRTLAVEARSKAWRREAWKPGPVLSPKDKNAPSIKYIGQPYDSSRYDLIEDGWDHEHCPFCAQSLCDCGSENCQAEGFTDGRDWICRDCHEKVIVRGINPTPPRMINRGKAE